MNLAVPAIVLAVAGSVVLAVVASVCRRSDRAARGLPTGPRWGPRRRAVAATLQAATAQRPGNAPSSRSSEQGNFFERVVNPAAGGVARLARRISPPGYVDSVSRRLTIAGLGRQVDSDRFLTGRLATVALVPVVFVAVEASGLTRLYRLLAFLLAVLILALGPEAYLNRNARIRQERIRRDLPGMVDLLMISVEAGLGFDQAMSRAVTASKGPLSEEFGRFLGEVRMGADRAESLYAVDNRTDIPELRSFLMALIQAETFGVSIGTILKAQARDIRTAQRQHVQELAQKAPVMMLFPLVFCVLPALFIVIIGPAGIEIYKEFTKYLG